MSLIVKNDLYTENWASLKNARDEASAAHHANKSSYLVGFMGLTGVCSGFAMESARLVHEWIASGKYLTSEVQLPRQPSRRIRHLEKLLILSVFRNIGPQHEWKEINRNWDPDLVQRVLKTYEEVIIAATGGVIRERQEFIPIDEMEHRMQGANEAEWDDHYLVILSSPNKTIYDWHVVYLHPKAGILADGNMCFSWRAPKEAFHLFPKLMTDYFKNYHTGFKEYSLYRIGVRSVSTSPLFVQQIVSRVETCYRIARYSPCLAGRFAISYMLPSCIYQRLFPAKTFSEDFYARLGPYLNKKDFDGFLNLVERQGHRIPKDTTFGAELTERPEFYLPLLNKLGPEAVFVACWLKKGMMQSLKDEINNELSEDRHELHRASLKTVLEARKDLNEECNVRGIMRFYVGIEHRHHFLEEFLKVGESGDYPECPPFAAFYELCEFGHLDMVKKFVAYGVNPNAPFYKEDDRPIDIARRRERGDIVDYLSSIAVDPELRQKKTSNQDGMEQKKSN